MSQWPTGWRQHTLRAAEIPVTQFALDILHYWEQSTPTDRYTNNPLGMPAHGYNVPRALNGLYAQFPTMTAFYKAFTKAAHAGTGKPLFSALATQDKHSHAWRTINGLNWPANSTETDYPAVILDHVRGAIPEHWNISEPADRKTVGVSKAATSQIRATAAQNMALHHAAHNIGSAADAIAYIVRGLNYRG